MTVDNLLERMIDDDQEIELIVNQQRIKGLCGDIVCMAADWARERPVTRVRAREDRLSIWADAI